MKYLLIIGTCLWLSGCVHKNPSLHYSCVHGATAPKDHPVPPPGANGPYVPNGHKCSPKGTYPDRHDDTNSATKYLNQYQYPRRKPPKRNDWTD